MKPRKVLLVGEPRGYLGVAWRSETGAGVVKVSTHPDFYGWSTSFLARKLSRRTARIEKCLLAGESPDKPSRLGKPISEATRRWRERYCPDLVHATAAEIAARFGVKESAISSAVYGGRPPPKPRRPKAKPVKRPSSHANSASPFSHIPL